MLTCREVYSESFASRVAGIYKAGKAAASIAAKTFAPQLTQLAGEYSQNIKRVYRAFNEPKSALNDLFESNPDKFRNCKLVKLIKDSAAGVITEAAAPYGGPGSFPDPGVEQGRLSVPPPARPMGRPARVDLEDGTEEPVSSKNNRYKGSYKAIFEGYVKSGNEANSPLEYSKNFSVTIQPAEPRSDVSIKYVADRVVFKDDLEFTKISDSASDPNAEYLKLFKTTTILQNKFQLDRPIFFDPQGAIDSRDSSKGFRLNFNGKVTFGSTSRDVDKDEYIIVINNRGKLQSDGKLYKGVPGTLMLSNVNINYSQKDILIESKKLVDLFCK
jgi:hypothetical protein